MNGLRNKKRNYLCLIELLLTHNNTFVCWYYRRGIHWFAGIIDEEYIGLLVLQTWNTLLCWYYNRTKNVLVFLYYRRPRNYQNNINIGFQIIPRKM